MPVDFGKYGGTSSSSKKKKSGASVDFSKYTKPTDERPVRPTRIMETPDFDVAQSPLIKKIQSTPIEPVKTRREQQIESTRKLPIVGPVLRGLDVVAEKTEPAAKVMRSLYVPGAGVSNLAGLTGAAESAVARIAPRLGNTLAGRVAQRGISEGIVGAPLGAAQTQMLNPDANNGELAKGAGLGAAFGGFVGGATPLVGRGVKGVRDMFAKRTAKGLNDVVEPISPTRVDEVTTSPLAEPTSDIVPTPPVPSQKGDWYTRLFGDQQSLRFSPFGGRGSGRVITTEQQIVNNPLKSTVKGLKENAKQASRSAYQNTVDYLSPLKKISREAYDAAMDASRANNIANTIVRDKFVDLEGNVIGSSLNDVMASSRGLGKKVDDYLILRHAVDRMRRGERVYDEALEMTPEKAEQAVARLEQRFPQLKSIGQEWNNYNDNMLKSGVKEGLVSPEAYAAMRTANPNYAAMKRQFTTAEKFSRPGFGSGGAFSGQNAPIQKVSPTGSTRKIVSPLRSAVEQTYAWKNAELRNRTMQEIVKSVQRDPNGMKGIVEIVKKPTTSYRSLDEALREGGSEEFLDQLNNDFKKLFQHAKPGEENIVRAMVKGNPIYLKVNDPEAVKALLGMGVQDTGIFLNVMQTLSNATKRSATGLLAPMFSIKSLIGDTFQAAIQSKNPVQHVGVDIPAAIFSSVGDILKIPGMKNLAEDFRRTGGEYSALLRSDRAANKSVRSLRREAPISPGGIIKGVETAAMFPLRTLEKIADTSENINRMAAFRRERLGKERTPENIRSAINAARESTTNFSRKGAFYKGTEALAPYSNAAVQSIYRLAKSGVKNPIKTLAGATTLIVLPKLYEFSKFKDDPDYQNLPARERYRNIIYSKNEDGTFNKAPMPMEYEAMAGLMTDVLNDVINKDPQAYKGTLDALANSLTPPMVSGALQGITQGGGPKQSLTGLTNATVFAPISAITGNKSFTGAPIVSQELEKFSTPYQYTEKTSGPAKYIGERIGMAPVMVDYLLKQYSGDLGRLVLPLTSDVGAGTPKATLFKNFIVDPAFTNSLTNDFYDASERLKQAHYDNQEKGAPLPEWYDDSLREFVTSKAKGSISKQLSDLSTEKKDVNKDKSLSAGQRAQKLRDLQRDMNVLYIEANMEMQKAGVPFPNR